MTDAVKHPIQDEESYTIFITPFRTEADEAHFLLQRLSTIPGSTLFGQGYERWEPLRDKLMEHLSVPETALPVSPVRRHPAWDGSALRRSANIGLRPHRRIPVLRPG
jgi:hypothetical protein